MARGGASSVLLAGGIGDREVPTHVTAGSWSDWVSLSADCFVSPAIVRRLFSGFAGESVIAGQASEYTKVILETMSMKTDRWASCPPSNAWEKQSVRLPSALGEVSWVNPTPTGWWSASVLAGGGSDLVLWVAFGRPVLGWWALSVAKVSCLMSQVITHSSDLLLTIAIVPPTGYKSLPPPPSTDADHHPVPPLTTTVPAPTIRCFSPQTLLFLSHLLHNPHLPSPPTTGTERIRDNHPPRHQLGQPPPPISPPSIFPKIFPPRDSLGDTTTGQFRPPPRDSHRVEEDHTSNPYAEFNVFGDPFAAYQVFHSGIPITLVPLDATNTIPINENFFDTFEQRQQFHFYC
ncbi:hypothetical protein FH972_015441 [Carpinus fangiana]|uniref:Inosine/uridine-preferring nucleoside hydrolase domain-containing protein n=1 Tax=Carpinus fangiana TaxID=176857 RepID=A0A5N6REN7_9ROSI|nr:hypothetical protein FH972_015441 [Carpinus fangiana]